MGFNCVIHTRNSGLVRICIASWVNYHLQFYLRHFEIEMGRNRIYMQRARSSAGTGEASAGVWECGIDLHQLDEDVFQSPRDAADQNKYLLTSTSRATATCTAGKVRDAQLQQFAIVINVRSGGITVYVVWQFVVSEPEPQLQ